MTDSEDGTEPLSASPGVELLLPDLGAADRMMVRYQELTRRQLDRTDWIGDPGAAGSFVKKTGWRKIQTFYRVSTEIRQRDLERDQDGRLLRAYVLARAVAPDGRYADGDGACSSDEQRFRSVGGRAKIEHDLPATAATRATNRAISNLVGFGAVSAEEVEEAPPAAAAPAWAAPVASIGPTGDALVQILEQVGYTRDAAADVAVRIGDRTMAECGDTLPTCIERLLRRIAKAALPDPAEPASDPDPGET